MTDTKTTAPTFVPATHLTYGDSISVEIAKLPVQSLEALLKRGFSHFIGNEQASKVAAAFAGKPEAEATDEMKAAKKAEVQTAAIAALLAGTVGVRASGTGGTKATPKESIVRANAKKEVTDILKHNKIGFPTGEKKVKMPDGAELTGAELIARYVAKHGERLGKEADAELKRRARDAEKVGDLANAF